MNYEKAEASIRRANKLALSGLLISLFSLIGGITLKNEFIINSTIKSNVIKTYYQAVGTRDNLEAEVNEVVNLPYQPDNIKKLLDVASDYEASRDSSFRQAIDSLNVDIEKMEKYEEVVRHKKTFDNIETYVLAGLFGGIGLFGFSGYSAIQAVRLRIKRGY